VVVLVFVLGSSSDCSQLTEAAAFELAKTSTRKALGDDGEFLTGTRDTALESTFAACVAEPFNPALFMFRLTNAGEETIGNTVKIHLSLPAPAVFIVAVTDIGEVFRIRNGNFLLDREIESLARRYRIRLSSTDAARRYLQFYLAMSPRDGIPRAAIASALAARACAERQFKAKFGETAGASMFDGWWQRHRSDISNLEYDIQVAPARGGGFSASYYYFLTKTGPKRPQEFLIMLRASMKVSAEGRVADLRSRPMWR